MIDVAETVRVTELISMKQEHGESVRSFIARLRGKAHICAFQQQCAICKEPVRYSDHIVRWVLLAGLASPDISREVLGMTDIDSKSLPDTIALIEAKERAARALIVGDIPGGVTPLVAGISSYKKSQQGSKDTRINCTMCNRLTVNSGKTGEAKLWNIPCAQTASGHRAGSAQIPSKPHRRSRMPPYQMLALCSK